MIRTAGLDVVIEATGHPRAAIRHCLTVIDCGVHVIMVSVEADGVAGPLLARRARGLRDLQPRLRRSAGDHLRAGRLGPRRGLHRGQRWQRQRYLPRFHQSTPDTVWQNFGITPEMAARFGKNARMFNSFIDGSKSAIEMTAVCNATGLTPQPNGLGFPPPASCYEPAEICKPRAAGGSLSHEGTTEVVSSLHRDGRPVEHHLQIGTYVVIKAGEILDGEGGYYVWGKQMPAAESLHQGGLPLILAHGITLRRAKKAGELLSWADVVIDEADAAYRIRREMAAAFRAPNVEPAQP